MTTETAPLNEEEIEVEKSGDTEQVAPVTSWVINLSWIEKFWQSLVPRTFMRLNPHWHIEKPEDETYEVEDILIDKKFSVTPKLQCNGLTFSAVFAEIGLTVSAVSEEDGKNTTLSYDFTAVEGSNFSAEDAEKTLEYWLPSLREYYRLHQSGSFKHRFWRFFMDKVILTMNPTQRRITGFMFKLTVLEILFIVAIGVGWHYYGG